ncbi:MAG: neutral zinc metallopeptidase [Acidimicrobiales bacterium]
MVIVTVVGLLAVVVVAGGVLFAGSDRTDRADGEVRTEGRSVARSEEERPDRTVTDRDDNEVVRDALAEVEAFWADTFPQLYGEPYVPIQGGFQSYNEDSDLPSCPGVEAYEDVAQNAFYCPDEDLIAWDESLIEFLRTDYGELTIGMVMAHEIGHGIQPRAAFDAQRTVTIEQQADCFAGAWVRSIADGANSDFGVRPADLDAALAGVLLLRDPTGADPNDPDSHGSAFDRVLAVKEGFDSGAGACANYSDDGVAARLVQFPFTSRQDLATGGNVPLAQIERFAVADLEHYWSIVFQEAGRQWDPVDDAVAFDPRDEASLPPCAGEVDDPAAYVGVAFYCEVDDFVAWDDAILAPELYENGGDFAVATVIGEQYSMAAQFRLGATGEFLERTLEAACYTGTWAASVFLENRPESELSLSPGDLDEAVLAMLTLGDPPDVVEAGKATRGSGFQRVGAFQNGFLNGTDAC